jgi:sugar lactone lactonase YvrE
MYKKLVIFVAITLGLSCSHIEKSFVTASPGDFSISPMGGPLAGGNSLTVSGESIIPNTTVSVGGNPCPVSSYGQGSLVCTVPAGTASWASVAVTIPAQTAVQITSTYAYGANVIGQSGFNGSGSTLANSLSQPAGVLAVGNALYIADGANHRVLGFLAKPTTSNATPSFALGATTLNDGQVAISSNPIYGEVFRNPSQMCSDGTSLAVLDTENSRVLIFTTAPVSSPMAPSWVLGQNDYIGRLANHGGATIDGTMLNHPKGLFCNSDFIAVADSGNHRVLIWNGTIQANGQAASVVLGQSDFASTQSNAGLGAPTATTLSAPQGVSFDGTNLFVADTGNQRVLAWTTFPLGNATAANLAFGPTSLTSASGGGCTSGGLKSPVGITTTAGYLYISDSAQNRVLGWNTSAGISTFPNGQAASISIGQANLTTCSANQGSTIPSTTPSCSLRGPTGIYSDGTSLWIADSANNRVVSFNPAPTASGVPASLYQGQAGPTGANPDYALLNTSATVSGATLEAPQSVAVVGNTVYVSDSQLNRVTAFSPNPSAAGASASLVLGQTNLQTAVANLSDGTLTGQTLNAPMGVFADSAQNVYVADSGNNRVAIFTGSISGNDPSATYAMGQGSLTSNTATITATGLHNPNGFCLANGQLFVSDSNNNRVLVFNSWSPTGNGTAASYVIGQANMTSAVAGLSATGLNGPGTLACNTTALFVADENNNRVLKFALPIAANTPSASLVLGQSDFVSGSVNRGAASPYPSTLGTLWQPRGLAIDGANLYISDSANNRILAWHALPTSNGQSADVVYGQTSGGLRFPNAGTGMAALNTLFTPGGLSIAGGLVYIADTGNSRILVLPEF